jgi:hypothetical protein
VPRSAADLAILAGLGDEPGPDRGRAGAAGGAHPGGAHPGGRRRPGRRGGGGGLTADAAGLAPQAAISLDAVALTAGFLAIVILVAAPAALPLPQNPVISARSGDATSGSAQHDEHEQLGQQGGLRGAPLRWAVARPWFNSDRRT